MKRSAAAGAYKLWVVGNLEEPRPQKLALEGLSERPHCMAVIEPRQTLSGCVEVGGASLYVHVAEHEELCHSIRSCSLQERKYIQACL